MRFERMDLGSERAKLSREWANFRPKGANFRPERLAGGTIKLMNEQTEEEIKVPMLYRTLSPSKLLPKMLEGPNLPKS